MATSVEFIEYVCEQVRGVGEIRYKKMFGEYMVYINDKPILLVCDNTVYVKINEDTSKFLQNADIGVPYGGAKEHYVLDIENRELTLAVLEALERVTPLPKKRAKK